MARLRTDQACLEAQMQQQIAQNLNAELAVPCPDCGVESGRACRDSLDRAVRTHLARSVAANRRDTEPCPAPPLSRLEQIQELNAAQESLTRAAARAFAESHHSEWLREELERRSILDATISLDPFSGYLEVRHSGDRYARVSELEIRARELRPNTLSCSSCREFWTEESLSMRHHTAHGEGDLAWVETVCQRCYAASKAKTPTASDLAPAIAPEAVASTPTRPVCACGQTIEHVGEFGHAKIPSSICERCFLRETMACTDCSRPIERRRHWPFKGLFDGYGVHDENGDRTYCNDCWPRHDDYRRVPAGKPAPLDKRIAETKSDDATECAWSTPTSEGEGWQ